jgi:predicted CopG family antitoxin
MGTKNIPISDDAYQRLKALKKPGESFTDVIERMTRSKGILEIAGMLAKEQGRELRMRVEKIREESSHRITRTTERLR